MSQLTQRKSLCRRSRTLLAWLLNLLNESHRPVLLGLIAIVLGGLLASLTAETRRSFWDALLAQRRLILLPVIFSLLTLSLLWSAGQRLDAWVFTLFNLRGRHPRWLDRAMWALTQIGNGAVGILLGIYVYFTGHRRFAFELLLGILTLSLAVELIKMLVQRARPFHALENTRVIGWRERGKSFPSGHTAQAFFMMTLFTQAFRPNPLIGVILFTTAVVVGFTRIYVGVHYPRDVIAGAILGSVWGILSSLVEAYLATGQI